MEHVAEGYIQELASCSFFQSERSRNNEECFRIHDLLHDLADMVIGTDCFKIENESGQRGESWKGDIPRDVRHIFIRNYDAKLITEETLGLKILLTLFINVVGKDTNVVEKIIDDICKKLPNLWVLAFDLRKDEYGSMDECEKLSVPESLGQLKHLRYFAFRTKGGCKISLPCTLNKLQHIQLLDFGYGTILKFTSAEIVKLRHIICFRIENHPYIGRLSSVQTLPNFELSTEEDCELKQLRDLNKLRGKLWINGLENVKSKEQALQANLTAKEHLTEMSLQWLSDNDTRCSSEVEEDVLEGLCPPKGLQILQLSNFAGSRYPDWMLGKHRGGPKFLQKLHLLKCSQPQTSSRLVEAFPRLWVLNIWDCSWDSLPDNMKDLILLKELYIFLCQNIRSLPALPQSIQMFQLYSCNAEFMKSCQTAGDPNWQKIEHIPNKYVG